MTKTKLTGKSTVQKDRQNKNHVDNINFQKFIPVY